MPDLRNTHLLADHIELDHERELTPADTPKSIRTMHKQMHENRDDWDHTHD